MNHDLEVESSPEAQGTSRENWLELEITRFLQYMKIERNASIYTLRGYGCALRQFQAYCNELALHEVGEIKTENIRSWLYSLNVVPKTLSHRIAAIKSLFKFLLEQEIIEKNPAGVIKCPKVELKLPQVLQSGEAQKLLSSNHCISWVDKRNRAIIVLLIMTGIRREELRSLNLENVKIRNGEKHNGYIRVCGKGMKEREIPLNELASKMLQDYISAIPITNEAVFVTNKNKRICGDTIRLIVRAGCIAAGIRPVSPHKLRHTFATMLHEKGVDVVEIQNLLGHSNINTTMIYTHTSNGKLEDAVNTINMKEG